MKTPRPVQPRFESKFKKSEGCWNWEGGLVCGYGQFAPRHGKNVRAHRFSYELYRGEIPTGMCVLHRCDNPRCVNPGHLFLGTNLDNTRDMIEKGRMRTGRLYAGQKAMALDVSISADEMARKLGVTPERVNQIRREAGMGIGRGNAAGSMGERNGRSKLTDEEREWVRVADAPAAEFALYFGVTTETIHQIRRAAASVSKGARNG